MKPGKRIFTVTMESWEQANFCPRSFIDDMSIRDTSKNAGASQLTAAAGIPYIGRCVLDKSLWLHPAKQMSDAAREDAAANSNFYPGRDYSDPLPG